MHDFKPVVAFLSSAEKYFYIRIYKYIYTHTHLSIHLCLFMYKKKKKPMCLLSKVDDSPGGQNGPEIQS